jgi:hypothetical protein
MSKQNGITMSAKENLSALLATRGKGGSIESISQAATHFSADKSLSPSDFLNGEKLEAAKATTLFGGFITSRYGIEPKVVFSMRDVIGSKQGEMLSLFDIESKEDFLAEFSDLEAVRNDEVASHQALRQTLGIEEEDLIKSATKAIGKIARFNSPKARYEAQQLVATLNSLLEYQVVGVKVSA